MLPTRGTLALGVGILVAVVSTHWYRVNVSPSVPYGVYRLTDVQEPLARGALVVLPAPQGYPWPTTLPLMKPIAAIAGDTVCVLHDTLIVEGVSYGPVLTTHQGHSLPHLTDCLTVPDGAVFVASHVPRSLDSRYFGMVPTTTIVAQAVPVLTW